jgi:hypothetical protein
VGDVINILREASSPVLLLAIVVLAMMVKRMAATNHAMREAEAKRNADHLTLMEARMEQLDRNDQRRQMSMADGVERFKQLTEADQANASALVAISREFVRSDACRECQEHTQAHRDRCDRIQERLTERLEALSVGQIEIKQELKQGLALMTSLLSKVVKIGAVES